MKEINTLLLDNTPSTLDHPYATHKHQDHEVAIKPVQKVLHQTIPALLHSKVLAHNQADQDPFYIADLSEITKQYNKWATLLPRVKPFYAVKCNPDPMVIKTLADLGTGFDCASKPEIQLVLDAAVDPTRIIYANPCKQTSQIRYAASRDVRVMTFDNADELQKVAAVAPSTNMVLRILTDDSKSICRFGVKFGASISLVPSLLNTARELGLNVIGVSFHVGSGCFDASSFTEAVQLARQAFDIGASLGFDFSLLDIGGGFPGNAAGGLQFASIAKVLGPAIDALFPLNVRVIAEPGRYFVSSAYTLAVNIIARRVISRDLKEQETSKNNHPGYMYYINDGMYGSFNCLTFDHASVTPIPLFRSNVFSAPPSMNELDTPPASPTDSDTFNCSIWGPTCDSIDLIGRDFQLPEMRIGDWLVFERMGAYTMAAGSRFNGFGSGVVYYTKS